MANKRKTTTAVVAGVVAVALLLGGTFAWVSISQQAKNETTGVVNVGGRLHDDFNGKNKDVYVENFTDPYKGGQPIYARVKLTEYMEVGSEAGKLNEEGTAYDTGRKAASVVEGATIDNPESWSIHKPADDCAVCVENGTPCVFHSHWQWQMGGQTTFMPTFNKDKDSLEADVNGTYQGTDATDKIYYDDYLEYTTDETNTEKVYSETETAYYDNDPDMEENTVEGQYTTKEETHYAKETVDGSVMTMAQWIAEGSLPGNYWVYDTDGWAYWANPIMPGEATGLLLSQIEMYKNPGEKCYYAINVVGQFATVGDWEQFGVDETDADYPSSDAIDLLTTASQNVPAVTVVNVDGKTLVNRNDTVTFSASTSVGSAVSALAEDEYEWVVLDDERNVTTSSTIEANSDGTATLTVGAEELNEGLYVAARSKNNGGAVGLSAVAVQLYTVTVTEQDNTTVAEAGETLSFTATVTDSNTGDPETSGVTWTLTGQSADTTTNISDDGVLTIDENEQGATVLTVTATSVNGAFVQTYTVTVADKYTVAVSMAEDNDIDPGDELTFTAAVTKNGETDTASGVNWTVTGGNGNSSISEDGVLTIDSSEQGGTTLTVTATSKADGRISDTLTVTISDQYAVTVTSQLHIDKSGDSGVVYETVYIGNPTTAYADDVMTFTANVTKNGATDTASGVTWSVSGGNAAISDSGVLTVGSAVTHNTVLTVTATSKADGTVVGTYPVTLYDGYTRLKEIEPGTLETVKIDGMRWYALAKEGNNALIWAAQVIPGKSEAYFHSNVCVGPWHSSASRSYLNGEFYNSLTVLGPKAVETTITTADDYNRTSYTDTIDKVFLPTEADLFGTVGNGATSDAREYTLGKTGIIINEGMRKAIDNEDSWLRSPWKNGSYMPQLQGRGTLYYFCWSTKLRPAMWVDISE